MLEENRFADCTDLEDLILQTVGAATSPLMWGEDGVFQEDKAIAIGFECLERIRAGIYDGTHALVYVERADVETVSNWVRRYSAVPDRMAEEFLDL